MVVAGYNFPEKSRWCIVREHGDQSEDGKCSAEDLVSLLHLQLCFRRGGVLQPIDLDGNIN